MDSILKKVVTRLREDGLWNTSRWGARTICARFYEWKMGINTRGFIPWDQLTDDPACVDYEPTAYHCIDAVFRHLDIRAGRDVFLDYGCGKGRAILRAAMFPFGAVIGVERSPDLSAVAEDNLRRTKAKLECRDVQIKTLDATDYDVPPEVTVIFFFNPFTGHVLSAVQNRIRDSLLKTPRQLTLVYMYPHKKQSDAFAGCSWLTKQQELSDDVWEGVRVVIYRSEGHTSGLLT